MSQSDPAYICPTVEVSGPGGRITINQTDLPRYISEGYKKIPGTDRTGPKDEGSVSVRTESKDEPDPPSWKNWDRVRLMKAAESFGIKTKGVEDAAIIKALDEAGFDGKE